MSRGSINVRESLTKLADCNDDNSSNDTDDDDSDNSSLYLYEECIRLARD